jgi:glycosyltransferase involved in cell wall biosynthesis
MLGWEYPPHISGGLGTACEGLTRALAPLNLDIDFVVPALYGVEQAPHMRLTSPETPPPPEPDVIQAMNLVRYERGGERVMLQPGGAEELSLPDALRMQHTTTTQVPGGVEVVPIPALLSPYITSTEYKQWLRMLERSDTHEELLMRERIERFDRAAVFGEADGGYDEVMEATRAPNDSHYGRDLYAEVARYATRVGVWARRRHADIVHAHDWMTFPAASRVARMHGIPLIVHVHSLEQDRAGDGANPTVVAIEGAGVRAATRVITVSHYTARLINRVHGVPLDRIDVVHNGVYARKTVSAYQAEHVYDGPVVLFLGRITYQKGPDYFVEAAAKVLQKVPNARFVMAGSGDMLPRMKDRVRELGIESNFEFPGFVRGADVEHLFSIADAYVMPSVSEPFGISALEAMSYETPVILSRQSGASEILRHALKVDFWDINKLAAQIVAVLSYPELRRSIVDMAREEVRRVHWEAAAAKVKNVYQRVLGEN